MFKRLKHRILSSFLLLVSSVSFSVSSTEGNLEPWFTGPILAPSGHTTPKDRTNLTAYGFYSQNKGFFNRERRLIQLGRMAAPETIIAVPVLSYGISDRLDIQAVSSYVYQELPRFRSNSAGDTTGTIGFQVFKQNNYRWLPSLRFVVFEIFPTGRFNRLSEVFNGANAVGVGGYRTGILLAFQHLNYLPNAQYLRTRLAVAYVYSNPVNVNGVTGFGGTPSTHGRVKPGNIFSADLAFEMTLDQNWVAVMEAYYLNRGFDRFTGTIGRSRFRANPTVGRPALGVLQLLPAIEYNFNANVGLLGGFWFPVIGRAAPNFITYTLALNLSWSW